jgi:glucokinase
MKKRQDAPVLAADIGGTKLLTALVSADGRILVRDARPSLAAEGPEAVIGRLTNAMDGLLKRNDLKPSQLGGIGIACAGGIDTGRGVVVTPSPNMPGWVDIPLASIIGERFGAPAGVINDASAAALGEHRYGAGKGLADLVLLTIGTGIGGGIIASNRLYLGAAGGAGEIGHTAVADGPECGCGNNGCLEMLASGRAVARDARTRLERGEASILNDMVDGDVDKITAEIVGEAARRGDGLAQSVIDRAAHYLGVGLVNVTNIFNPEMIIIGGSLAALGDMLIEPGRRMVAERAFSISSRAVRIVTASLGNEAGVYGAAVFARERAQGDNDAGT